MCVAARAPPHESSLRHGIDCLNRYKPRSPNTKSEPTTTLYPASLTALQWCDRVRQGAQVQASAVRQQHEGIPVDDLEGLLPHCVTEHVRSGRCQPFGEHRAVGAGNLDGVASIELAVNTRHADR